MVVYKLKTKQPWIVKTYGPTCPFIIAVYGKKKGYFRPDGRGKLDAAGYRWGVYTEKDFVDLETLRVPVSGFNPYGIHLTQKMLRIVLLHSVRAVRNRRMAYMELARLLIKAGVSLCPPMKMLHLMYGNVETIHPSEIEDPSNNRLKAASEWLESTDLYRVDEIM